MKKKIILIFLSLIFTISLLIPERVFADCFKNQGTGFCPLGSSDCKLDNQLYCCATANDCTNFKIVHPPASDTSTSDVLCKPAGGTDNTGIQTAIGCIPTLSNTNDFLAFVLKWAVGVGGGIAFLLILYGGFMVMSSGGNPERLKAGQELLTSAISGLILLIFSVFILKFIGIDILGLGAFGFGQ